MKSKINYITYTQISTSLLISSIDDSIDSESAKFRGQLSNERLKVVEDDEDYFIDLRISCMNKFSTL